LVTRLGLTLCSGPAYRWAVEPVSTGAACPRSLIDHLEDGRPRVRGRAVPAEQAAQHQPSDPVRDQCLVPPPKPEI